jgi:hypothetical protein
LEGQYQPKHPGRPRLKVDDTLVLRLRDEEDLGWSKGAAEYRRLTGQWISRDTFKRRYLEAKAAKSPLQRAVEELPQKREMRGASKVIWQRQIRGAVKRQQ